MPEWLVQISDEEAVQELTESFREGPIIDDQGRRPMNEAQVDRVNGLKIEVFADEHPPPHFRVTYQGLTANYRISDCGQINGGLARFYRNVRRWHTKHKTTLIDAWNQRRPTNCPVGPYRG